MFKNYLKITLRNLLKYKTYSLINVFGLTLGLFSCILIVLFVRDELSYDTFHENSDRIYRVVTGAQNAGGTFSQLAKVAAPWGPMLEQEIPEIESYVRLRPVRRSLLQNADKTFYESGGLYAGPQIFDIFTFEFLSGDPRIALNSPDAIVLSESMARKLYGEQPAFGRRVTLNGRFDFVVRGVLADVPDNSHFHFDFLLPYDIHARAQSEWQTDWGVFNYYLYILLVPGADARAVESKIPGLLAKHVSEEWAAELRPFLQSLPSIHLHSDLRGEFEANGSMVHVYILSAIASLILLVACINFMNLATARASTRAKEVGVRKVIGAGQRHLVLQFLGEAFLVSLFALLAAIGLVELSLPLINRIFSKELVLSLTQQPDLIAILLAITLSTVVLGGGYPAFFLSKFQPIKILKGKSFGSASNSRLRRVLVIAQFASSAVLLIGSMTIFRQLQFVSSKNPGFNREQVVAIPIDDRRLRWDLEGARNRLADTQGVIDAAITSGELTGGDWAITVGYEGSSGEVEETFRMLSVTHNFIDVMEIPLVAGRNFSTNYSTDAENAVLVNEKAAALFGGISGAIGKVVNLPEFEREAQVIGVVRDFNFRSLHEQIKPMILFIAPEKYNYFYARLEAGALTSTLNHLEQTWASLSPSFPFTFTFLDEQMEKLYGREQRLSETVSYFTGLAMLVACIGLLGLASFTAERRTKEIGVRKVLGASVIDIVSMLSKEFAWLVILANFIAWPIAWLVMSLWLQNFAYRIEMGWWMFTLAGGFALVIALLTVSTQAIKAALANPVESLRYE